MLTDFLASCIAVLDEETADFRQAAASLSRIPVSIGLMPAISDDLFPVYSLACTSARRIVSPNVYFVPTCAAGDWAKPCFEKIADSFYQEDSFREQYEIELEEMLLLRNSSISGSFRFYEGISYNVLYCHLTMPNGSPVYLFIVPLSPGDCWKEIIEPYGLKCDILIDSHKGMGDWFDSVPLYSMMRETQSVGLLPRYYFKGLFISHEAPEGFNLIYTIPETIEYSYGGRPVDDWQKRIYEIDWRENRKHGRPEQHLTQHGDADLSPLSPPSAAGLSDGKTHGELTPQPEAGADL